MPFCIWKRLLICSFSALLAGCALSPDPISRDEVRTAALADMLDVYRGQEQLERPLTLHEAMARALKYNLENRVAMMQEALARGQSELVRFDMLPTLAASAGYVSRENFNASSSVSIITREQSLEPSFSQEKQRYTADLRFSWNILDFGVSYLQARQEADRFLIAQRQRQRIMLNLLQQTRGAFWRAAAAQAVETDVRNTLEAARSALADVERVLDELLQPPLETLQLKRELLQIVAELETLLQDLAIIHVRLANLVNMPPTQRIALDFPANLPPLPELEENVRQMELLALANSSDYAEQLYNLRIAQRQSRIALLRLLPGLELGLAQNFDSNDLLVNNFWREASIQLTANLLQIVSFPKRREVSEAQENLAEVQRQAVAIAVVTQTNLAWERYSNAARRLVLAGQLDDVERSIAELTSRAATSDAASQVDRIQSNAEALRANLQRLDAYANAQEAFGSILVSLGLNPVPGTYREMSVAELAEALQDSMQPWELGMLPDFLDEEPMVGSDPQDDSNADPLPEG